MRSHGQDLGAGHHAELAADELSGLPAPGAVVDPAHGAVHGHHIRSNLRRPEWAVRTSIEEASIPERLWGRGDRIVPGSNCHGFSYPMPHRAATHRLQQPAARQELEGLFCLFRVRQSCCYQMSAASSHATFIWRNQWIRHPRGHLSDDGRCLLRCACCLIGLHCAACSADAALRDQWLDAMPCVIGRGRRRSSVTRGVAASRAEPLALRAVRWAGAQS